MTNARFFYLARCTVLTDVRDGPYPKWVTSRRKYKKFFAEFSQR
jgi:hypothetical protein